MARSRDEVRQEREERERKQREQPQRRPKQPKIKPPRFAGKRWAEITHDPSTDEWLVQGLLPLVGLAVFWSKKLFKYGPRQRTSASWRRKSSISLARLKVSSRR